MFNLEKSGWQDRVQFEERHHLKLKRLAQFSDSVPHFAHRQLSNTGQDKAMRQNSAEQKKQIEEQSSADRNSADTSSADKSSADKSTSGKTGSGLRAGIVNFANLANSASSGIHGATIGAILDEVRQRGKRVQLQMPFLALGV